MLATEWYHGLVSLEDDRFLAWRPVQSLAEWCSGILCMIQVDNLYFHADLFFEMA
jgi:hypothetical protein